MHAEVRSEFLEAQRQHFRQPKEKTHRTIVTSDNTGHDTLTRPHSSL